MRKILGVGGDALVPTAIAGIYGMNFDFMPELRWRFGYSSCLRSFSRFAVSFHRLFRRNGWL